MSSIPLPFSTLPKNFTKDHNIIHNIFFCDLSSSIDFLDKIDGVICKKAVMHRNGFDDTFWYTYKFWLSMYPELA
jgi:hypothetical protein